MTRHAERQGPRLVNRWRLAGWSAAALLLLSPLAAMPFTDAVAWGPMDFLLAGALVGGLGLGCEWAVRTSGHWAYRAGVGLALATAFVLVWANAAVGISGSEDEAVNGLFYLVPGAGMAGAVLARFRAKRLAWVMLLTAGVQAVVTGIAANTETVTEPLAYVFVGLWVAAAGLLWMAGQDDDIQNQEYPRPLDSQ